MAEVDLDRTFHALADPTRRAVVRRLRTGPATVRELAEPFRMALPSFMKHIRVLEDSGWVRSRKTGRVRTCSLDRVALIAVESWLEEQRRDWSDRADRLQSFLEGGEG